VGGENKQLILGSLHVKKKKTEKKIVKSYNPLKIKHNLNIKKKWRDRIQEVSEKERYRHQIWREAPANGDG
jgi:hypothetical protein